MSYWGAEIATRGTRLRNQCAQERQHNSASLPQNSKQKRSLLNKRNKFEELWNTGSVCFSSVTCLPVATEVSAMNLYLMFRMEVTMSIKTKIKYGWVVIWPRVGDVANVFDINTSLIGLYLYDTSTKY